MKHIVSRRYHKTIWFLLFVSVFFFILRLPSLFEPYWYGDEGIYHVIGDALRAGRVLYTDIWDNKPPLLYVTYALFGSDQFAIRAASLIFGLGAIVSMYFLSQKLFTNFKASALATLFFAIFFGLPMFEGNIANAENFMLFPITLAMFFTLQTLLNQKVKKANLLFLPKPLFLAGILLGIAFLYKTVAIFDVFTLILFSFFVLMPHTSSNKKHTILNTIKETLQHLLPLFLGFLVPLLITTLYFLWAGAFFEFISGAFSNNIGYVGYNNAFLLPQGLVVAKLFFLVVGVSILFLKRKTLPHFIQFILLWLLFSLFNAFFTNRPYTHYVLVLLPAVSLLVGSLVLLKNNQRISFGLLFLFISIIVYQNFWINKPLKTYKYYENFVSYLSGEKKTRDYIAWFDENTPRDYDVATYIKLHTRSEDSIFLWGNSAQIYTLSDKLPLGRYTVAYHILSDTNGVVTTNMLIQKQRPKYIFVLPDYKSVPIDLTGYQYIHSIEDTAVYEKSY